MNGFKSSRDTNYDLLTIKKNINSIRKQFKSLLHRNGQSCLPINLPKINKQFINQTEKSELKHRLNTLHINKQQISNLYGLSDLQDRYIENRNQIKKMTKKHKKLLFTLQNESNSDISHSNSKNRLSMEHSSQDHSTQKIKRQLQISIKNIGIVKKKNGTKRIRKQRQQQVLSSLRNIEQMQQKYENRIRSTDINQNLSSKYIRYRSNITQQVSPPKYTDVQQNKHKSILKTQKVQKIKDANQSMSQKINQYLEKKKKQRNVKNIRSKSIDQIDQTNQQVILLEKDLIKTKNKLNSKQVLHIQQHRQTKVSSNLQNKPNQLQSSNNQKQPHQYYSSLKKHKNRKQSHRHSIDIGSYLLIMNNKQHIQVKYCKPQKDRVKYKKYKSNSSSIKSIQNKQKNFSNRQETKYTPWNFDDKNDDQGIIRFLDCNNDPYIIQDK